AVVDEVGVGAEGGDEVGRRGADGVGEDLRVQLLAFGRFVDGDRFGEVARVEHDVRVGSLGRLYLSGEVGGPVLVFLEQDYSHPLRGRVSVDRVGHLEAEVVVGAQQSDRGRL